MTLQNRADPTGQLFANPSRGMFTGNRGTIHDPSTKTLTGRGWTTKAWIICDCGFKGRKRQVFGHNRQTGGAGWTNLFFLDEVTALAAGHRPCFECRRAKAKEYADCFARAFGLAGVKAADMDARLHNERWLSRKGKGIAATAVEASPEGVVFQAGEQFLVRRSGRWLTWNFGGYSVEASSAPLGGDEALRVTPAATVGVLAAGYQPVWHASSD